MMSFIQTISKKKSMDNTISMLSFMVITFIVHASLWRRNPTPVKLSSKNPSKNKVNIISIYVLITVNSQLVEMRTRMARYQL